MPLKFSICGEAQGIVKHDKKKEFKVKELTSEGRSAGKNSHSHKKEKGKEEFYEMGLSSETERRKLTKEYRPKINRERIKWGSLIAGLVDSDGHINEIPQLIIKFNKGDASVAYDIKKKIGFGVVRKEKGEEGLEYRLGRRGGLEKVGEMMRNKLRDEERIRQYNERLSCGITRKAKGRVIEDNWLSGFMMGGGRFKIKIIRRDEIREEVRIGIQIDQKKEEILKRIKEEMGGEVKYREKQDIYNYSSKSIEVAKEWVKYLDENQMIGRRYLQYVLWRKVLVMMERGEHLNSKGRERIKGIKERITRIEKK